SESYNRAFPTLTAVSAWVKNPDEASGAVGVI
ncbi:unnamed protein product, partial [marine sediment metagenome]